MVVMGLEKPCIVMGIERMEPNHRVLKENQYTSRLSGERGEERENDEDRRNQAKPLSSQREPVCKED
jgi:hypothetical protein